MSDDETLARRIEVEAGVNVEVAADRFTVLDSLAKKRHPCWLLDSDTLAALGVGPEAFELEPLPSGHGYLAFLPPRPTSGGVRRPKVFERTQVGDCVRWIASLATKRADAAERILGNHPEIRKVREQLRRVAVYRNVPVLVLGETGTGKELVANAVHELGVDCEQPLVSVNCAALPETLFESELFGHEAGSFTGARKARVGLLEEAATGTVFLDEIGEMPLTSQPKLLRALETRTFRRIGSNRTSALGARIVSATNRTLRDLKRSSLRPDLFYRLAGFTVLLPPLRERIDDLPLLADHFLREFLSRHGQGPSCISDSALEVLRGHTWPGNVRELRGVIEHGAILASDACLSGDDAREAIAARPRLEGLSTRPPPGPPLSEGADSPTAVGRLRDVEREMITSAFRQCGGNVSKAARKLGIPRSTLRDRLRRYGLA